MTPIFSLLISLKRSEARRAQAVAILEKSSLKWEILEGVDGLQLQHTPPEYHEAKVSRLLGYPLTTSEIGCFLSHRLAWIRCIEKGSPILILEDDFVLKPNFEQALEVLLSHYPEWDIARLQGLVETSDSPLYTRSDYQIVENLQDPLGATAYIVKPDAAKKLIRLSNEIYEPLDHFLEHKKIHHLKVVAFKPYPVEANGMVSTMHDRGDRIPIQGLRKHWRSMHRAIDRLLSSSPWFPR